MQSKGVLLQPKIYILGTCLDLTLPPGMLYLGNTDCLILGKTDCFIHWDRVGVPSTEHLGEAEGCIYKRVAVSIGNRVSLIAGISSKV